MFSTNIFAPLALAGSNSVKIQSAEAPKVRNIKDRLRRVDYEPFASFRAFSAQTGTMFLTWAAGPGYYIPRL
jgi:hypothetical protein